MSGIVLSASVRQNLLSLQSTADLLSTTQNRLATGKKVNSALDNPTNFFTAASLDNRASDINNLLDGIGNGVQVLQAANTGISSLQKLVDSAKSVANQALQTHGRLFDQVVVTTAAITGATASNLLGTVGAPTDAAATPARSSNDDTDCAVASPARPCCRDGATATRSTTDFTAADTIVVNGMTINFNSGGGTTGSATAATSTSTSRPARSATSWPRSTRSPARRCLRPSPAARSRLHTGTAADLVTSGDRPCEARPDRRHHRAHRRSADRRLDGLTLTIGATGGGTATSITFGTGTGGRSTRLNESEHRLAGEQPAGDDHDRPA